MDYEGAQRVHHRLCITAVALAWLIPTLPALAQTDPSVPPKSVVGPRVGQPGVQLIQARREVLFQAMLARPDDLDAAFEYAALSAQVGDLEAAISTLERMLIFAPGLPRLQLELGVLYYRMGAFETARLYFEGAVAGADVPPEVKSKVDEYLAGIDGATETTRFTGQVRAGIRYQTNANRAPTDSVILLNDVPFVLSGASLGSPDGNVYASGVFHVSHALPTQGDLLELDLVTYGSKQFERDELDVALAELTFGPAFDLGRFGIENAAIGVYGIASGVVLGGDFYSSGIGAGSRIVVRPNPSTWLLGALEYRWKDYENSDTSPAAELRDWRRDPCLRDGHLHPFARPRADRQRLCAARLDRARLPELHGGRRRLRPPLLLPLAPIGRDGTVDRSAQYRRDLSRV